MAASSASVPTSFTKSQAAFRKRAAEVGLVQSEVDHLIAAHVDTLSKLAFVLVPPGKVPDDDAVKGLLPSGANRGSIAGLKRLLFEAHTLIVSELKQRVEKSDDSQPVSLNVAERDSRLEDQKSRLGGLSSQGDEEVAHDAYNLVYSMVQKDDLLWLSPEKFGTCRAELSAKKQGRELVVDGTGVAIKEKPTSVTCAISSELDLVMAFRRRALAFDLVGVASFNVMNKYHQALAQRLQEPPPPGYSRVSVTQVLRADRAVFLRMAEQMSSLRRSPSGTIPLDVLLANILMDTSVAYHLLPLPAGSAASSDSRRANDSDATAIPSPPKNPAKRVKKAPKKTNFSVPRELVGKLRQTPKGHRLCWGFNLPCGCKDAKAGGKCAKGLHLCAEPGCLKPHSLQQHSSS